MQLQRVCSRILWNHRLARLVADHPSSCKRSAREMEGGAGYPPAANEDCLSEPQRFPHCHHGQEIHS